MLYICTTTTTKCEILEKKNANCKVTLKKLWCRLLRSNSELAWKEVKVKQQERKKKVWKLLWKTCWHPASDLSFSKWCNCDHLEYWFPMGESSQNSNNLGCANVLWIPKMQQLFFMVGATGLSRLMICFRGWLAVNITSIIPSLFPDRAAHGT